MTHLEASKRLVDDTALFDVSFDGGTTWDTIVLDSGVYNTYYELTTAIELAVLAATGKTSPDFYCTPTSTGVELRSDTYTPQYSIYGALAWLGFSGGVYSGQVVASDQLPEYVFNTPYPPFGPTWTLQLQRQANFTDAGDVVGVLRKRVVYLEEHLHWRLAEQDAWEAFFPVAFAAATVAVFPHYTGTPGTDYVETPLQGTGYALLELTDDTHAVDGPEPSPHYSGQVVKIKGVVHGL